MPLHGRLAGTTADHVELWWLLIVIEVKVLGRLVVGGLGH